MNKTVGEILGIAIGNKKLGEKIIKKITTDYPHDLWVRHCTVEELTTQYNVSESKAAQVNAIIQLGYKVNQGVSKPILNTPKKVADYFSWLVPLTHEEAWVAFLDTKNQLIGKMNIGRGTIDKSLVDMKDIIRGAILHKAKGAILVHNHPSGNSQPSTEDKILTENVRKGLSIFECSLLDHVILGQNEFVSFSEEGML